MIYGNGMVGSAMLPLDSAKDIFFASGVSNSMETSPSAFMREKNLVEDALALRTSENLRFHYFSTTGVECLNDDSRAYFHHKKKIEDFLIQEVPSHRLKIYRLPNVVGKSSNPHTLTNFVYTSIQSGQSQKLLLDAKRELLDVSDLVKSVRELLHSDACIVRIPGLPCTVGQLVEAFTQPSEKTAELTNLLSKYYRLPVSVETKEI